ncbi:014R [Invertebrate iridescent virus Kaz2018]|nr:014R [Invertebrate iridescent virus Kaz2018]
MPSKYIREASDEDSKCFFIYFSLYSLILTHFCCPNSFVTKKEELSNKSSLKYSGLFTFSLQRLCSNPSRSFSMGKRLS